MLLRSKTSYLIIAGLLSWTLSAAQAGFDNAYLTGSLETNSIGYLNDSGLGSAGPEDWFGSNNYLKLDYVNGKISSGIQLEAYLPALYGYEIGMQLDSKPFFLASKYISWTDNNFSVHIGDFYDQIGNGLIFRSYEDRNLGLNNSIEGIKASCSLLEGLTIKGMYGRPRLYCSYASSLIRGADLMLSLDKIFGWDAVVLNFEGGFVNRYEQNSMDLLNLNLYSASADFSWKGLTLKGEFASKGKDFWIPTAQKAHTGAAVLAEAIYSRKTFSASASFRIIDHMGTMLTLDGSGTGNALNYLPSLTRQYHYMLANLNPYQVDVTGECASQADVFYTLKSRESRSKYWVFHANFSGAWTISPSQCDNGGQRMTWCDANVDAECHWNKSLKTTFLYSRQQWSPTHGYEKDSYVSNIFVADALYKFNRKYSLRGELQFLQSGDYEGNWVAGLVEFGLAPHWNIYASDMYNAGLTGKHYYNVGASYSKGNTRVQLSYGRNRAGFVCSGGVCRYSPAYTGINLLLTTSF